jgi:hypothetical protein
LRKEAYQFNTEPGGPNLPKERVEYVIRMMEEQFGLSTNDVKKS